MSSQGFAQSSDSEFIDMGEAQSVHEVIAIVSKFANGDSSIEERLAIYAQISPDILNARASLGKIQAATKNQADLSTATELFYLTALDVKLASTKMFVTSKLRDQRILRRQFIATIEAWRVEAELGTDRQLIEPREDQGELSKATQSLLERSVQLAYGLIAGMDEAQIESLSRRQKDWLRQSSALAKTETKSVARERRAITSSSFFGHYKNVWKSTTYLVLLDAYLHSQIVPEMSLATGALGLLDVTTAAGLIAQIASYRKNFNQANADRISLIHDQNAARNLAIETFFSAVPEVDAKQKSRLQCALGAIGF